MSAEKPLALKEVQLRLAVPQHVLIHLCEKGVIEPDFAETSGRGKRREFSERNLFEFGVALALRRFELPVATTAFVVRLLRSFARTASKASPGFSLPETLVDKDVDLTVHFYDGDLLVLAASGAGFRKPLFVSARFGAPSRAVSLDRLPQNYEGHLEIKLGEIARRVLRRA